MDEEQYQLIIDLLKKNQRSLTIIQYLAGITLGFLLGIHILKAL